MAVGSQPVEVRQTQSFSLWLEGLRDTTARARIDVRIRRLALGNAGDAKSVSGPVRELRIDHGPGYRVYFARVGPHIILLLAGGDKSSQSADIVTARQLLTLWEKGA